MAQLIWWEHRYDPVTREVRVLRMRRNGIARAYVDVEYAGLTWHEALQVLEDDATAVLLGYSSDTQVVRAVADT